LSPAPSGIIDLFDALGSGAVTGCREEQIGLGDKDVVLEPLDFVTAREEEYDVDNPDGR
jgi:hypothetical protein